MNEVEHDELERAGRALRDAVGSETAPNDRVRARARTIVRHRRIAIAGSVASLVIATSIGIGFAARGGNGLGVHTISPAGSSTTRASITTDVRPTVPITAARGGIEVPVLPTLAFADALHGWRVEPLNGRALEHTVDGGRTWTVVPINVPGEDTSPTGVVAIDDRHAFSIVVNGIGNAIPRFIRTTDGVRWVPTLGIGVDGQSNTLFASFADARHAWGVTQYGDPITTADGGDHWRAMTQPAPMSVSAVCLQAPGSGWAATGQAVYRSDDDGATWRRQVTIPVGGGLGVSLVCNGQHVVFSSFDVGAGQHIGAFIRSDDGGAHWSPLTEDTRAGTTTVTAPGFPDNQFRGQPIAVTRGGTLAFTTGCSACGGQNWVVVESSTGRFVIGRFDSAGATQIVLLGAAAVDATHLFVETQTITADGTGPRPVTLYASSDGGHTWSVRWTGR